MKNPTAYAWMLGVMTVLAGVAIPTLVPLLPSAGAQNLQTVAATTGAADHYQECQPNDTDGNPATDEGELCAYASVVWSAGAASVDLGGVSDSTGFTPLLLSVQGQLILDGISVTDDTGEEIVQPGTGADLAFISGDEAYPDSVAPAPVFAGSLDCVVATSNSNATVTQYNNGPGSDWGVPHVVGSYRAYDALGMNFSVSGPLWLVESFVPAEAQTSMWQSDSNLIMVPSTVSEVAVEVSFESQGVCDARAIGPLGPNGLGPAFPVGWGGIVADVATYGLRLAGGCTDSEVTVTGTPSQHGADFDGSTTITLTLGAQRTLWNHTIDAPPNTEVTYQAQGATHQWSVVAKSPGPNDIEFHATTVCLLPFKGADENLSLAYSQWMGYKCAQTAIPSGGARLNVGFGTMPSLTVGGTYQGATVLHVDSTLRFASVLVPSASPVQFLESTDSDANVIYCEPDQAMLLDFTPNDPQYGTQYGPVSVRAPQAWDTTLGDTDKTLCVIDSGLRDTHEDLSGARFLGGYDYIDGDTTPNDVHGHGTHVTGIAAATTNNNLGVAGIGQVGVKSVKLFDANGGGATDGIVASAIRWCADNGGNVINLSLGRPGTATDSATLLNAVNYAWNSGVLLVASAGNANGPVGVPALYDNVMAVSCTDSNEVKCGFSNFGPEVDIAAPGNVILATCFGSDSHYCSKSGTSMSSPHVAGAAALVWSQHTGLTNAQLRWFLQCSAKDLGAPKVDTLYGWGLLDIEKTLTSAATLNCPPPPAPVIVSGTGGQTTADLDWTLAHDGGSALTGFRVYRGTCSGCETFLQSVGPSPYHFTDTGLTSNTNYFYQVSAVNQYGGEGPKSNEFLVRTTNPPPPGNAGSMSCYPEKGSAPQVYVPTGSYSGTVTLTSTGSYATGNGANCVFEIHVNPRSGSDWSVSGVTKNNCTAAKGNSCTATTTFNWSRSVACFDVPYWLKVNGKVVSSNVVRICDPPLWGYLPL